MSDVAHTHSCAVPASMRPPQVKVLLHAADISNHVRPFDLALAHAERIQQEFQRQVARERALGLPVSPHMDAPEQSVWYKMEVSECVCEGGWLTGRVCAASSRAPPVLCAQTWHNALFVLSPLLSTLQVQFIDYVAGPLWERLGQVCVCMGQARERGWLALWGASFTLAAGGRPGWESHRGVV